MGMKTLPAEAGYVASLTELAALLRGADYLDVKTAEGSVALRGFVAAMLSYRPGWMKTLFALRGGLAWLLRLRHARLGGRVALRPEDVSFTPGEPASFFVVKAAEEGRYWVAEGSDRHLTACLAVAAEPLPDGLTRFHVATVVHYRHWTGPLYFALILPFHHLIAGAMTRHAAGVKKT